MNSCTSNLWDTIGYQRQRGGLRNKKASFLNKVNRRKNEINVNKAS